METEAPGLRWRTTRGGKTPMWRASKAAIRAGYPVKTVNLAPFADNERLLVQRCQRTPGRNARLDCWST